MSNTFLSDLFENHLLKHYVNLHSVCQLVVTNLWVNTGIIKNNFHVPALIIDASHSLRSWLVRLLLQKHFFVLQIQMYPCKEYENFWKH